MDTRTYRGSLLLSALTLGVVGCAAADEPEICRSLPGTAAEIAATPRDDENLELLALRLSDGITADDAVYQRLKRDIAAIRAQAPELRDVGYFAPYRDGLYLSLDDASNAQLRAGKFEAWECLNRHFNVTEQSPGTSNSVTLIFKGRYNLDKVASLYGRVPGITAAQPVQSVGDGPTIYVTQEEAVWHYVFNNASGDCPAGCTVTDARYFAVGSDGIPQPKGEWRSAEKGTPPQWAETYLFGTRQRWQEERLAMSR